MPQLAPHMADRARALGPGRHDLTLDGALQASLEALVRRHRAALDPRLSLAIVLADHHSGEILAAVGSPDYTDTRGQGFVDMTRALRSPGSTLKPLVYGLAFDRGLAHPETLILDTPAQFGGYAPQNFDGRFRGELPVRQALQLSLNIPVVRLTEALGPAHLLTALEGAGMAPVVQGGAPGLALALGGLGVTLEEMVQLYATLARGGEARALRWHQGLEPEARTRRILSRASAWQLGDILSDLAPPPAAGPPGRVAYKTGTSYGHRDAWALGWDGRFAAGVWIGRPDGTPVPGAFGGALAAPLLFEALGRAAPRHSPLPPPPPETLVASRARLPEALQRFGPRDAVPALQLIFPPEGARLDPAGAAAGIPVKLRGGRPPYTLLRDGAVVATGLRRPAFSAPVAGLGFTTLTVIDAEGRSGRVSVELR
jgi:penicillin-binding protein 1C